MMLGKRYQVTQQQTVTSSSSKTMSYNRQPVAAANDVWSLSSFMPDGGMYGHIQAFLGSSFIIQAAAVGIVFIIGLIVLISSIRFMVRRIRIRRGLAAGASSSVVAEKDVLLESSQVGPNGGIKKTILVAEEQVSISSESSPSGRMGRMFGRVKHLWCCCREYLVCWAKALHCAIMKVVWILLQPMLQLRKLYRRMRGGSASVEDAIEVMTMAKVQLMQQSVQGLFSQPVGEIDVSYRKCSQEMVGHLYPLLQDARTANNIDRENDLTKAIYMLQQAEAAAY